MTLITSASIKISGIYCKLANNLLYNSNRWTNLFMYNADMNHVVKAKTVQVKKSPERKKDSVFITITVVVANSQKSCLGQFSSYAIIVLWAMLLTIGLMLLFNLSNCKHDVEHAIIFDDKTVQEKNEIQEKLMSRTEWKASSTKSINSFALLQRPVPEVIIMHTATNTCATPVQCSFIMRTMQIFHMRERHWDDIGYNFVIGGDGKIYEGRGWLREGAHTIGHNTKNIGIALIGNFELEMPKQREIDSAQELISLGVTLGYIAEDYKLLGARQLQETLSPGANLYKVIQKWPHWSQI